MPLSLASLDGVTPQLYADNLKCTSVDEESLLRAAMFTDEHIRAVEQEASSSKCILLCTTKLFR